MGQVTRQEYISDRTNRVMRFSSHERTHTYTYIYADIYLHITRTCDLYHITPTDMCGSFAATNAPTLALAKREDGAIQYSLHRKCHPHPYPAKRQNQISGISQYKLKC